MRVPGRRRPGARRSSRRGRRRCGRGAAGCRGRRCSVGSASPSLVATNRGQVKVRRPPRGGRERKAPPRFDKPRRDTDNPVAVSPEMPRRLRETAVAALLIAALVAAVYWPVGGFGFVRLDDEPYISRNPHVLGGLGAENVRWAFSTLHAGFWIPLDLALPDARREPLGPGGRRLPPDQRRAARCGGAALLRAAAAVARDRRCSAARRRAVRGAPAARGVRGVGDRAQGRALAGALPRASCSTWLRHVRQPSVPRHAVALSVLALALMAKPMAFTTPVLLLLLDWWPLGRLRGAGLRRAAALVAEKLPAALLGLGFGVVTLVAQERGGAMTPLAAHPVSGRVANAAVTLAQGLGRFVWPAGLSPYYPGPPGGVFPPPAVAAGGAAGGARRCGVPAAPPPAVGRRRPRLVPALPGAVAADRRRQPTHRRPLSLPAPAGGPRGCGRRGVRTGRGLAPPRPRRRAVRAPRAARGRGPPPGVRLAGRRVAVPPRAGGHARRRVLALPPRRRIARGRPPGRGARAVCGRAAPRPGPPLRAERTRPPARGAGAGRGGTRAPRAGGRAGPARPGAAGDPRRGAAAGRPGRRRGARTLRGAGDRSGVRSRALRAELAAAGAGALRGGAGFRGCRHPQRPRPPRGLVPAGNRDGTSRRPGRGRARAAARPEAAAGRRGHRLQSGVGAAGPGSSRRSARAGGAAGQAPPGGRGSGGVARAAGRGAVSVERAPRCVV